MQILVISLDNKTIYMFHMSVHSGYHICYRSNKNNGASKCVNIGLNAFVQKVVSGGRQLLRQMEVGFTLIRLQSNKAPSGCKKAIDHRKKEEQQSLSIRLVITFFDCCGMIFTRMCLTKTTINVQYYIAVLKQLK